MSTSFDWDAAISGIAAPAARSASVTAPIALSEGYRVAQAKVAGEAAQAAATAFNTLLDPSDLDKTFPVYAAAMARVVDGARGKASAIGGAYYLAHREASGILGKVPSVAWQASVPPASLQTSLLVTGPVSVKRALSQGVPLPQALKAAETKTLGAVFRHTANAGRTTIAGTVLRDSQALGWARVTDGRPCAFCAMLASRGAVYKNANTAGLAHGSMKYHDKCGCFVVPVYTPDDKGYGLGPELSDLWDATRDEHGHTNFARFRAAYDAKYPKGTSPGQALASRLVLQASDDLAARAAKITESVAAAEAAKKNAVIAKWKGKPKPEAPTAPVAPKALVDPDAAAAWADSVADVKGRDSSQFLALYHDDPSVFPDPLASLKVMRDKGWLTADEYAAGLKVFAPEVSAADVAAYKKAMHSYKNRSTRYKRYIKEWEEANAPDPLLAAKWQGKPAPVKPKPPVEPVGGKPAASEWDEWALKVTKRYNALGTGKPFSQSYNYKYVTELVSPDTSPNITAAALKALKDGQYLDDALYKEALDKLEKAARPDPADLAAYKRALASFDDDLKRWESDLAEWKAVNAGDASLSGMDEALQHLDNDAGVRWANTNLPVASGSSANAVKQYTGHSYTAWNAELRAAAGDDSKLRDWAAKTRTADKAFEPAPEAFIVRRGTDFGEFDFGTGSRVSAWDSLPPPEPRDLIGTVQTQYGYTSTSVGKTPAFNKNVQIDFKVPAGHRVSWAMPYSNFRAERELLLSRNTRYFIHDVYVDDSGKWIIEAEILPEGVDPAALAGHPTLPRTVDARPRIDPKFLQ